MSGKLIAVANMKGGVGKTTTVMMLAETLAAANKAVLVIDLDPQASVSLCLVGDDDLDVLIRDGKTLDQYLTRSIVDRTKTPLPAFVRKFASSTTCRGDPLSVALLAAAPMLRIVERQILSALTRRRKTLEEIELFLWQMFQAEFEQLRQQFDYVIFDCAPGISPFTEVAIRSADVVVVPTIANFLSTYGLNAFCGQIWGRIGGSSLPVPRRLPHVLVTLWRNTNEEKRTLQSLVVEAEAEEPGIRLFDVVIKQNAQLAAATCLRHQTHGAKYGGLGGDLDRFVKGVTEALNDQPD